MAIVEAFVTWQRRAIESLRGNQQLSVSFKEKENQFFYAFAIVLVLAPNSLATTSFGEAVDATGSNGITITFQHELEGNDDIVLLMVVAIAYIAFVLWFYSDSICLLLSCNSKAPFHN